MTREEFARRQGAFVGFGLGVVFGLSLALATLICLP